MNISEKCTHCDLPIEKYGNKEKKICKQCYSRMMNANNRGIEYIKIKDLPEDKRNSILKRRESHKNSNRNSNKQADKADKVVKSIKINKNANLDFTIEKNIVLEDIKKAMTNNNIDFPLEVNSITPTFKMLKALLDGYNSYIKDFLDAENILNRMEIDYKHAKEHYTSLYIDNISNLNSKEAKELEEKKKIWEERHNILLNYRRDIKNVIAEYNSAGVFIQDLANDKSFMEKFNTYYNKLMTTYSIVSDGVYKAEVSSLVESEDFCLGYKNINYNKRRYNVIIKTQYLGNFSTFNRIVVADNEEEAKQQVINFIESRPEQFRFTWKSNDITVQELSNINNPRQ